MTPEPEALEPETKPKKRARARRLEVTFDQFIEAEPEPSPSIAELRTYLARVGVPAPIGELFFPWAQKKWGGTDKKYRDWKRVLLRALSEDWHRLWRFGDGGSCYLTTAGQQLDRETQGDP